MATKSGDSSRNNLGLDYWRDYFGTANSGIFEIIERAIMVAASDCPKEFRVKRGRIAELLFSCRLTRCLGCDRVDLAPSGVGDDHDDHDDDHEDDDDDNEGFKYKIKGSEFDELGDFRVASKGSKVNSTSVNDHGEVGGEMEMMNQYNPETNFSYGDAEALTDKIEEERGIIGEVLRIKEILLNSEDESDSVLFDSLRRLQLMALNMEIFEATEIGKAVYGFKKHGSEEIRNLARTLIDDWMIILDEWVEATQETAAEGGTPDSVNPSTVEEDEEEEGLPSPPLDEGFLFSAQDMELSQFFDGMDDDGNPRNCGEFNENREVVRKTSQPNKQDAPKRRDDTPKEATPISKDTRMPQVIRQVPIAKPNKPLYAQSGPGRPVKPNTEAKMVKEPKIQQRQQKPNTEAKMVKDPKIQQRQQKPNTEAKMVQYPKIQQRHQKPMIQRRPAPPPEKLRSSNEDAVQEKIEASKRKLQEGYQQAENAKRQRTIQVMELHDLPKQGLVNRNKNGKFGNYNRNRANARR